MREEKSVYKALFSEQKSNKVELTLVNDLNKVIKEIDSVLDDIKNKVAFTRVVEADRNNLLSILPNLRDKANDLFEKGISIMDKAQTAAQNLGMKPSNITNYDKLENNMNVLVKDIDSVIKAHKSIK